MDDGDGDVLMEEAQADLPHQTNNDQNEEFANDVYSCLMEIRKMSSVTILASEALNQDTESGQAVIMFDEEFPQTVHTKHEYPHLVRKLKFIQKINCTSFNQVCGAFYGLQILELGLQQIELLSCPLALLHFPELRALKIGGHEIGRLGLFVPTPRTLFHLMLFMQKIEFPKLTSFALSSPYIEAWERPCLNMLLHFLEKHKNSLKDLILRIKPCVIPENWISPPPGNPEWLCVPHFVTRSLNLGLDLRNYFVYANRSVRGGELGQLLERIGRTQTFLQTYIALYHNDVPFYNQMIFLENNSSTLVKLTININPDELANCEVFSNCYSLQTLVVSGWPKTKDHYETENYEGKPARPGIIRLKSLPSSLRFLQIVNLFMQTSEIKDLANGLSRLNTLHLIGIGEKENLGMTLELFIDFLVRRRIDEIGVHRGFNKTKIELDRKPGTPSSSLFATLAMLGAAEVPFSFESIAGYSRQGFEAGNLRFHLHKCPLFILREALRTSQVNFYTEFQDFNLYFEESEPETYKIFSDPDQTMSATDMLQ